MQEGKVPEEALQIAKEEEKLRKEEKRKTKERWKDISN